jgi:hypothetical protein
LAGGRRVHRREPGRGGRPPEITRFDEAPSAGGIWQNEANAQVYDALATAATFASHLTIAR